MVVLYQFQGPSIVELRLLNDKAAVFNSLVGTKPSVPCPTKYGVTLKLTFIIYYILNFI